MTGCTPPPSRHLDADLVLAAMPQDPGRSAHYEVSAKAGRGGLARSGRFSVWLRQHGVDTFGPVRRWLDALGAPDSVRAACGDAARATRQGAGVAITPGGVDYRLYLQQLDARTRATTYDALRWRPGSERVRRGRYAFHFAPVTPAGERPSDLVPDWARAGVAMLADDTMVRRISGFWLRYDTRGAIDQFYLTVPWAPRAGSLAGVEALLDTLALPPEDRRWLEALHIRHIAVPAAGAEAPAVTFYASAELAARPAGERALQAAVAAAAARDHAEALSQLARFPPAPISDPSSGPSDIAAWRAVLGEGMHQHHGLFPSADARCDAAALLAASQRAVRELYPHIAPGASVYDVGCGWGGPLAMLAGEHGCRALGLTDVRDQFRHVAGLGLPVRWGDAERTLPPGWFDCVLLLESLEHMRDPAALLHLLRGSARRLVMRVNCGGADAALSAEGLRRMLAEAGWSVVHWRDRRRESGPGVAAWRRRLAAIPPGADRALERFRHWCDAAHRPDERWAAEHPLIEVVAD